MTRSQLLSVAERVGGAAAVAFLGAWLANDAGILTMSALHAAEAAGVAAGLSALKTGIASLIPGTAGGGSIAPAPKPAGPPPLPDLPAASGDGAVELDPVEVELLPRQDIRLGRHREHDERSRSYEAPRAAQLKTVHHRHYGTVLDQGQLGSCTGNAAVDCLMTKPLHINGRVLHEADAVKIYELATKLDSIRGAYPPEDTGSSGIAAAKACVQLGLARSYTHAFGLQHCLEALVLSPVMVGIPWTEGMFTPDKDGYIHPTGNVAGGHEIALIGLDMKKRHVVIQNSWGASWGRHGRAYLSFDDLDVLLSQGGDVTVLHP